MLLSEYIYNWTISEKNEQQLSDFMLINKSIGYSDTLTIRYEYIIPEKRYRCNLIFSLNDQPHSIYQRYMDVIIYDIERLDHIKDLSL